MQSKSKHCYKKNYYKKGENLEINKKLQIIEKVNKKKNQINRMINSRNKKINRKMKNNMILKSSQVIKILFN